MTSDYDDDGNGDGDDDDDDDDNGDYHSGHNADNIDSSTQAWSMVEYGGAIFLVANETLHLN